MTVAELERPVPETVAAAPASRAFLLRSNAPYRRFWIGQAVSELGDGMAGLALVVLVHRLAGTISAIATLTILTSLPQILLGLHAGVLVDRWDRRRTMIGCDLGRMALAIAVVFVQDPRWLPALLAIAVAQAAASVFFEPARAAFVPAIVERGALLAANSFSQTTRVACMSAGAAVAGLLLALPHGMKLVFAVDALTFLVSALALGSVRVAARVGTPRESGQSEPRAGMTAELVAGLRMLFGNPTLVALLTTFAITLLGLSAVTVLFVPFMLGDLRASTLAIGLVRVAQTLGMVGGGALMAGPAARWSPTRVLTLGIAGLGPCLALMGLAPHWVALLPLLALIGVCSSAIQTGSATLLQHAVPDQARGRAESALDTLLTAVMLVAMGGAGALGDRFGARAVFVAAGLLAITAGLVGRARLTRDAHVQSETFVAES